MYIKESVTEYGLNPQNFAGSHDIKKLPWPISSILGGKGSVRNIQTYQLNFINVLFPNLLMYLIANINLSDSLQLPHSLEVVLQEKLIKSWENKSIQEAESIS